MVCVWILVFNTTFNNISVISVLFVEESGENYRSVTSRLKMDINRLSNQH